MRKFNKFAVLIMALIITMSGFSVAATQNIPDLQQQQQDLRQQADGVRGDLAGTRQEMSELEAEIEAMDLVLEQATDRLFEIEDSLQETMQELEETEIALELARQERDEHFERFKTRLRVIYVHGPVGYLEVVLQATSFSDFLTRLDHMNTIARSDSEITDRLMEAEALVEYKLEQTFRQRTRIESLQLIQTERIADLDFALAVKYDFMSQLERDANQHLALIRQLEQADRDIAARIQRIRDDEAAAERRRLAAQAALNNNPANVASGRAVVQPSGGAMNWPLPGRFTVSSGYGNRRHPISGRGEFHTGIDLPAPSGTTIVAADSGMVVVSGRMGGYGNTVVIDHGNGLSTLYAHNSRNLVSEGQWVNRGDPVALVGSTGVSTGPHLHFEVRRNGGHINPGPFIGIN